MKIPGIGRFNRKIATLKSRQNFGSFKQHFRSLVRNLPNRSLVDLHIVSFSGSRTFEEQIFSILSFYYNVGKPLNWTIYSDGSHTEEQMSFLRTLPFVSIYRWDSFLEIRYSDLIEFGKKNIWGNRMHAYMNHVIDGTTIFTDSDILFYKGFQRYRENTSQHNWFIPDTGPHFEKYYFEKYDSITPPFVNAGFLIINESPDWTKAMEYLFNRPNKTTTWEHFTEQTAVHVMLSNEISTRTLDESDFVLSCTDSFKLGYDYDPNKIAVRHYVSPVRHKMWQYSWKKVLGV